jgi:hypothetical protein
LNLDWQKGRISRGPRLESQNHVFDTPVGSLAITTISVAPNRSSIGSPNTDEEIIETFAGTMTLLPKTTGKNIKIRAFFTQKVATRGSFSFIPILSFHAVIPDDSRVFQLIEEGNLHELIGMLKDGLASLTDCDTQGRSLLWVKLSKRDKYSG